MQWVVTTGRSVEEARERALDALGVDAADLEVEVLAEPETRWFGLRRTEARIRARVRPTRPRPKVDRRNRRRSSGAGTESSSGPSSGGGGGRRRRNRRGADRTPATDDEARTDRKAPSPAPTAPAPAAAPRPAADPSAATRPADAARRTAPPPPDPDPAPAASTGARMSDITLDEQETTALGFVQGLVDAFGLDAEVASEMVDDEHLEIAVTGTDLGILVGPRGATLSAIQELTRTAVAQQHSGRLEGRLRVDVAGYRARRQEALERFAVQQAERVLDTGARIALEPMSPPDRKIVHDAINSIDGVHTVSEGEDRRRHVVILPD